MRRLYTGCYDNADRWLAMLANCGCWLTPNSKILDYGCGNGQLVYNLRDLGFDAYGFDIHETVNYRSPEDRKFFGFVNNPERDTSNMVVQSELLRVPFPENFFDVVISFSVLEHIMDLPHTMSEIARVLKSTGISVHQFPGRTTLIEPHMFVPLGTRIQNWPWLYLWALLGVRNEFQLDLPAHEVANRNSRYSRTGVRYLTTPQLLEVCDRYFQLVRLVRDPQALNHVIRWRNRLTALRSENRMNALSDTQPVNWLLVADKRDEIRDPIDMSFGSRVARHIRRKLRAARPSL